MEENFAGIVKRSCLSTRSLPGTLIDPFPSLADREKIFEFKKPGSSLHASCLTNSSSSSLRLASVSYADSYS